MALYPMAIHSDDDKWRTCPYLQTSRISIFSRNPMFLTQINRIGNNFPDAVKNFHNVDFKGCLGLGWSMEGN